MAPGYVIAACLEGAGAIGIVLALRLLHAEQRTRAGELARFLRFGQIPDTVPPRIRSVAVAPPALLVRHRDATPPAGSVDPSDALLALRSAYGAPVG